MDTLQSDSEEGMIRTAEMNGTCDESRKKLDGRIAINTQTAALCNYLKPFINQLLLIH